MSGDKPDNTPYIETLDRMWAIISDLDESQAAWVIVAMVYFLRLTLMDGGLSKLEANEQIIAGIDSLDGASPSAKMIQ
jgi:hypothetical protein